jgi:enamine deaminase RidA (YjgF/YER057c/UK114 family)
VVSWFIATAIAIAGLGYSSWLLEFVLHINVDPVNSFLSELDAEGKPYRQVFATADKVVGILLMPASIAGLLLFPRRRFTTVGWVALFCFAAATVCDVLLPLRHCTPHNDSACDGSGSELFPQLHQPHALTSTISVTAIAVATFAFSLAAFQYHRWRILREAGLAVLVIGSSATVWMLVADNLPGSYALGIAQRIQVGSMSLWLITLAAAVFLEGREWIDPDTVTSRSSAPRGVGAHHRTCHHGAMSDRVNISSGSEFEDIVGYCRAVRVGNVIAVSGSTASAPGGTAVGGDDIGEQTRETLNRIATALTEAGASLEDVVRTRIFVTDISRWPEVAKVHSEVFGKIRPAASMYEISALITPALLVEIEADAIVSE